MIDAAARERILSWIDRSGGEILAGGTVTDEGIITPTVIARPSADAEVARDEVFGPVCTVQPYESLDEAVDAANGTPYGLQAGVFTGGLNEALSTAHRLEFGGVAINEAPTFRADQMPHGGVKESGHTREGPHYVVRELTEEKLIVLQL